MKKRIEEKRGEGPRIEESSEESRGNNDTGEETRVEETLRVWEETKGGRKHEAEEEAEHTYL